MKAHSQDAIVTKIQPSSECASPAVADARKHVRAPNSEFWASIFDHGPSIIGYKMMMMIRSGEEQRLIHEAWRPTQTAKPKLKT
jgi:hypothetical protein